MEPTLIVFGSKAILRAAQAGADLYGEHARDRNIFLPDLDRPRDSRPVQLQRFLTDNPQFATRVPELVDIWDNNRKALKIDLTMEQIGAAYAMMLQHEMSIQLKQAGKDTHDAEREVKML